MNNVGIIEAGFNALCDSYAMGVVNLRRSSLFGDLFVFIDSPEKNLNRFTYAKLDDNKEILSICVFIVCLDKGTTDVGWFVRSELRGKGIGKDTVEKSFKDFKHGMKASGAKLLNITATIDEGNAPSISLGRNFIGGEEIMKKDDGTIIYSYLNSFQL